MESDLTDKLNKKLRLTLPIQELKNVFENNKVDHSPTKTQMEFEIWNKGVIQIDSKHQCFTIELLLRLTIYLTQKEYENFLHTPENFQPTHVPDIGFEDALEKKLLRTIRHEKHDDSEWRVTLNDQKKPMARSYEVYLVTFLQDFELMNFPFDQQILHMTFSIVTDDQFELLAVKYDLDYRFVSPQEEWILNENINDIYVKEDAWQTFISFKMVAERSIVFFCSKVLLILGLMTFTTNLGVIIEKHCDQLSFITTLLLTQVAYLYVVQDQIPVLKYLTIMDYYILSCILFSFFLLCQCTTIEILKSEFDVEFSKIKILIANVSIYAFALLSFIFKTYDSIYKEKKRIEIIMENRSSERRKSLHWNVEQLLTHGIDEKTFQKLQRHNTKYDVQGEDNEE